MSALASIMLKKGWQITGSDKETSAITKNLEAQGIHVFYQHDQDNVEGSIDLLVHSEAISTDNSEIQKAGYCATPILTYAQALGEIANEHKLVLVTGTHGKTTTTGMITKIALENNLDPTVVIGGKMKELNNANFRIGESNLWIVEGCEYRRSFLNFKPDVLVITNVDVDHLDYYKDEDDYLQAFISLIKQVKVSGTVVFNENDSRAKQAVDVAIKERPDLQFKNDIKEVNGLNLAVPGAHNRANAQIAFLAGEALGLAAEQITPALNKFGGTWRRLEYLGQIGGTKVYDDYAHHPIEIKATLQALRELYTSEKICCVFQPHQFNRTKHFFDEFAHSFTLADAVIIPNIYKVRDKEEDLQTLHDEDLVKAIAQNHQNVLAGGGLEHTRELILNNASQWDVIVLMGAGDIANLRDIVHG